MLGGINNQMFFQAFGGFFALLILIPLLRWTFTRGKSHVARPAVWIAHTGEQAVKLY
jgi:flagellar biogenesis protein FliO